MVLIVLEQKYENQKNELSILIETKAVNKPADTMFCQKKYIDKQVYVNSFEIVNVSGRMPHHVDTWTTYAGIGNDVTVCTYDGHGNSILGSTFNHPIIKFPEDTGILVPESFVYQIHYAEPLENEDIKVKLILHPIENPKKIVSVGSLTAPTILQQGESQTSSEKVFAEDTVITSFVPHMHDLGKRIVATYNGKELFNISWNNNFVEFIHLEEPLIVKKGDTLSVSCYYNNALGYEVTFPREMCFLGYYYTI